MFYYNKKYPDARILNTFNMPGIVASNHKRAKTPVITNKIVNGKT